MKATHRLTYIPDGDVYLFEVRGDMYKWKNQRTGAGDNSFSAGFGHYVRDIRFWKVEKINTFKGNK